jgi:PTH1 family peptidyl-tRNA hydrolase
VIAALGGTEFPRLRVGIGRSGTSRATVDHVLSTFRADEQELSGEAIATAADAVERWLVEGIDAAMNEFNGIDLAVPPA